MANKLDQLIEKADHLLDRLEVVLGQQSNQATATNWDAMAWRWLSQQSSLEAVTHPHHITLNDIQFLDQQKQTIIRNTRQFIQGLPANHVLLTGARGTGKSSLVKALLQAYSQDGLRLIEVEKQDLVDLPTIVSLIQARDEKFIIFCDDLSFEANDPSYKALKVVLDGSIAHTSPKVLVYATSNRKNLMPEYLSDNTPQTDFDGDIRPNDTIEEKTALAERFGIWLSFHSFDQEAYLAIAAHWLNRFGIAFDDKAKRAALTFSYSRGARSGRIAYQFAKDYAGTLQLKAS